jgi:hypothetical protein
MIKKLQLVVLGWVVFQGAGLSAMENKASALRNSLSRSADSEKRVVIKHPVEMDKEKHAKRQCMHLSVPKYILVEKLDWPAELKKNPNLAWLPI